MKRLLLLATLLLAFAAPAAAQDKVTLVIWDNFTRDAEQTMINQLNDEFTKAHPNVTIKRESYSTDDMTKTLPLALGDSSGPDVAMVNQGYTGMGALVKAGLLLPLNDYADKYKWWDRYAKVMHNRNSFTPDGKQLGQGDLYGVSNTAEVVGVYYNKQAFADLKLSIPKTYDEFEALLKTVKDAGKTPIVFGSLDGWPAIHLYGAIQDAFSTTEALDKFIYRLPGGTFDDAANLKAAQKLVEWVDNGYLSKGFEGMGYDDATTGAFLNGDGVMWITGSWVAGTISQQLGEDKVGFFIIPPADPKAPPLAIGGVGLAYGIRKTSANADIAAEYIDLVTGPRAAELLLQNGFLPAAPVDAKLLKDGTLTADVVKAWQTISEANSVGHYLDWTMPNIAADIQSLMAKKITPEQFVQQVEDEYKKGAES
jgi:raffinose/stachyose/melibiose transport system substrate-binding protein